MHIPTIYFAAAMRSGRQLAGTYRALIAHLRTFGTVLTEHVGDDEKYRQDLALEDRAVYARDMGWLFDADAVCAEVSVTSIGVGYEIGRAVSLGKPILCLYQPRFLQQQQQRLSAMIAGNPLMACV